MTTTTLKRVHVRAALSRQAHMTEPAAQTTVKVASQALFRVSIVAAALLGSSSFAQIAVAASPPPVVTESHILLAADVDLTALDSLGASVAISVDTAVVGAPFDDDAGTNSGAVYVFVREGDQWSQPGEKLTASDIGAGDKFGTSVAISGNTVVVGAPFNDHAGTNSGAVYVFDRDGDQWPRPEKKFAASDTGPGDNFGTSVAISDNTIIAGAPFKGTGDSGAAYVFVQENDQWSQLGGEPTASGAEAGDKFGTSVAISGNTVIVGAPFKGMDGAAYVFVWENDQWSQGMLTANDPANDNFGISVAISDGTAVVGTLSDAAYVFVRENDQWSQLGGELTAGGRAPDDRFGNSVAISGGTAVIGAESTDMAAGAAYVFQRNGADTWAATAKLTASDAAQFDVFGTAVAISGHTAVIGAEFADNGFPSNVLETGSAYVFEVLDVEQTPANAIQSVIATLLAAGSSKELDNLIACLEKAEKKANDGRPDKAIKEFNRCIKKLQGLIVAGGDGIVDDIMDIIGELESLPVFRGLLSVTLIAGVDVSTDDFVTARLLDKKGKKVYDTAMGTIESGDVSSSSGAKGDLTIDSISESAVVLTIEVAAKPKLEKSYQLELSINADVYRERLVIRAPLAPDDPIGIFTVVEAVALE